VGKSLKKLSLPSVSAVAVGKEKVVPSKRKPKRQESSSSSSEESSSSSSESSYKVSCHGEHTESEKDDQLEGGTVTPVVVNSGGGTPANALLGSYAALPVVNSFAQAQAHAQAQAEAQAALTQAQERVAALAAAGLVYQIAPVGQNNNGAPFKAPPPPLVPVTPVVNSLPFSYSIPKKVEQVGKKHKKHSKHGKSKKSKGKRSSSKKSSKHGSKKSKKESSSGTESVSSEQSGEEAAKQVLNV